MKITKLISKALKAPRAIGQGIQDALESWAEMAPYNISVLAQSFNGSTVTGLGGKGFDPATVGARSDFRRREMLTWHFLAYDRTVFGRFSSSAGLKWIQLGELYFEYGNPGNALRYALKGLAIVENDREEDPADEILIRARRRVATILLALGKDAEVLPTLWKIVDTLKARGKTDEEFVDYAMKLAGCLKATGDNRSSASVLIELTETLEKDGICTTDSILAVYKELSVVCSKLGNSAKSELYSNLASALEWLAIMENSTGRESRSLLSELNKLESLFDEASKVELRREIQNRISIVEIKAKVDGPDYPGIENDLDKLASYYEKRDEGGDKTVAFHLRKRIERIKEKARN